MNTLTTFIAFVIGLTLLHHFFGIMKERRHRAFKLDRCRKLYHKQMTDCSMACDEAEHLRILMEAINYLSSNERHIRRKYTSLRFQLKTVASSYGIRLIDDEDTVIEQLIDLSCAILVSPS